MKLICIPTIFCRLMSSRKPFSQPGVILFWLLLFTFLTACSPAQSETAGPINVEATVSAMLQATSTAEATFAQAVDEAAAATAAAATPVPQTVVEVSYVTMSEEELVVLIEEAVEAAVVATESYSVATTEAAADGTLTAEEVETIVVYVETAEAWTIYAEELIDYYLTQYGDLAYAAVEELAAIEQQLAAINDSLLIMNETLVAVNDTLNAGLELAEETIAQLEQAAAMALTAAESAQIELAALQQSGQDRLNEMLAYLDSFQPTELAGTEVDAIRQALTYADTVRLALDDNKINSSELAAIAQAGINATASLQASGKPQLQSMAGQIDNLTGQLARGDVNHAHAGLADLNNTLANLPSLPADANLPAPGNIQSPAPGNNLPEPPNLPGGRPRP